MVKGRPEGKVLLGFNAPEEMAQKVNEIAKKRGVNLTVVLTEALTEYIERRENPELLREEIRQALRDDPGIVAEAVQIYAARQLQKK